MSSSSRQSRLLYYIVLVLGLGAIAWMVLSIWPSKDDSSVVESESERAAHGGAHFSENTIRRSRLGSGSRMRRAKVVVNERLRKVFELYPELAVELHEPSAELEERFRKLFPETRDPDLGNPSDFDSMITGEAPWDEEAALSFLQKNEHRVVELQKLIDEFESFESVEKLGLGKSIWLLNAFYGLKLKMGMHEDAQNLYATMLKFNQSLINTNLLQANISIGMSLQLDNYNLSLYSEFPEIVHNLEAAPLPCSTMSQTMIGEFSSVLRWVYDFVEYDSNGELVLDLSGKMGVGKGAKYRGKLIPLTRVEEVLAHHYQRTMHYLRECENFDEYISADEMNEELERSLEERGAYLSDIEYLLTNAVYVEAGFYSDSVLKFSQLKQARSAAMEISYAQYTGEAWDGELPIHVQSGEPMIWDQENNQLHTHLEGSSAIIPIPVIK